MREDACDEGTPQVTKGILQNLRFLHCCGGMRGRQRGALLPALLDSACFGKKPFIWRWILGGSGTCPGSLSSSPVSSPALLLFLFNSRPSVCFFEPSLIEDNPQKTVNPSKLSWGGHEGWLDDTEHGAMLPDEQRPRGCFTKSQKLQRLGTKRL